MYALLVTHARGSRRTSCEYSDISGVCNYRMFILAEVCGTTLLLFVCEVVCIEQYLIDKLLRHILLGHCCPCFCKRISSSNYSTSCCPLSEVIYDKVIVLLSWLASASFPSHSSLNHQSIIQVFGTSQTSGIT